MLLATIWLTHALVFLPQSALAQFPVHGNRSDPSPARHGARLPLLRLRNRVTRDFLLQIYLGLLSAVHTNLQSTDLSYLWALIALLAVVLLVGLLLNRAVLI